MDLKKLKIISLKKSKNVYEFVYNILREYETKHEISLEESHKNVLIVVLTKIGLDQPNPDYFPFIKEYLDMPECVGMIGNE